MKAGSSPGWATAFSPPGVWKSRPSSRRPKSRRPSSGSCPSSTRRMAGLGLLRHDPPAQPVRGPVARRHPNFSKRRICRPRISTDRAQVPICDKKTEIVQDVSTRPSRPAQARRDGQAHHAPSKLDRYGEIGAFLKSKPEKKGGPEGTRPSSRSNESQPRGLLFLDLIY